MITNFEHITEQLSQDELRLVAPICRGLELRAKSNPIKGSEIVKAMNVYVSNNGIKGNFTDARLRKIIGHIRREGLLPVIATSKGYYVSRDKSEIRQQIEGLIERANAIRAAANGLIKFVQ